jgi:hypothetical protein
MNKDQRKNAGEPAFLLRQKDNAMLVVLLRLAFRFNQVANSEMFGG